MSGVLHVLCSLTFQQLCEIDTFTIPLKESTEKDSPARGRILVCAGDGIQHYKAHFKAWRKDISPESRERCCWEHLLIRFSDWASCH